MVEINLILGPDYMRSYAGRNLGNKAAFFFNNFVVVVLSISRNYLSHGNVTSPKSMIGCKKPMLDTHSHLKEPHLL